ncbi:MAG TPA: NAD-dependent epimerase/dehydratase family protein [Terracidiphilus sp.]|nr:NAD-dependent epimerase/dehydratase family protein [Terracidiphilus sp.]
MGRSGGFLCAGGYAEGVKPLEREDLAHVLEHTGPLWERARGGRLFLAGATGFFGAWLLESLAYCNRELDLGVRATVLSRDPEGFLRRMPHLSGGSWLRFVTGDVRGLTLPEDRRGERFDFVIHGASPTLPAKAGAPRERLETLIEGTRRMLALAKAGEAKSMLYVSSGAVYGRQPGGVSHIEEGYTGAPDCLDSDSAYGEGKRVAELMCAHHAEETGLPIAIARCFAFVGPHLPLDAHFAIGNFVGDALAGRPIRVNGDGTPMRSYLYAADLAIWLWTLLLRAPEMKTNPAAFNVGSGEAVSLLELARAVAEEVNPKCAVEIAAAGPDAVKSGVAISGAARQQYVPSVEKAERELGLRAWIGLREAIKRTAAWHR